MTNSVKIILLIIFVSFAYWKSSETELRIEELEKKVQWLNSKEAKDPNRIKIISQQLKNKITSVLSLRCSDSSKKVLKWNSTATKIDSNFIITAHHVINEKDIKTKQIRTLPFKCVVYSEGIEVAQFDSIKHKYYQIEERDIVIIQIQGSDTWKKILSIEPKIDKNISLSSELVLISHASKFINKPIVASGEVVSDDASTLIEDIFKKYWEKSILTNMSASPGSSGGPIFNLQGEFIGIHVGGERQDGLNVNYQLLFNKDLKWKLDFLKLWN